MCCAAAPCNTRMVLYYFFFSAFFVGNESHTFLAHTNAFDNSDSTGGHEMIDFTMQPDILAKNIQKARQNNVMIPTFSEMIHPETIPGKIARRLEKTGLWDLDPVNQTGRAHV